MKATIHTRRSVLALLGAGAVAACADTRGVGGDEAAGTRSVAAARGQVTAKGKFSGESDHVTSGGVRVVWARKKWIIELEDDFSHDGAPDPMVALGSDGFAKDAILGPLQSLKGRQSYILPDNLDIGRYNEVWIWCKKFNVPLGKAPLTLT